MQEQRNAVVASLDEARTRRLAERIVVCLECAAAYDKPAGGGTLAGNPGCPACGYVGWIGVMRIGRAAGGTSLSRRAAAGQTETRASSSMEV